MGFCGTGVEAADQLLKRASSSGHANNVSSISETASTSQVADAAHAKGTAADNLPPEQVRFDGRAFRRSLGKTGRYQRTPVNDAASLALMEQHGVGYSSTGLIAQMRLNGNLWQFKDLTIKLAEAYGYCWGVERAVQMAYEARQRYPDQRVHVTNEIIHNPAVNQVRLCTVCAHCRTRCVPAVSTRRTCISAARSAVGRRSICIWHCASAAALSRPCHLTHALHLVHCTGKA